MSEKLPISANQILSAGIPLRQPESEPAERPLNAWPVEKKDIAIPMSSEDVDRLLLGRLRMRDKGALRELVDQYGSALTGAAYLYLGDRDAAEDMAQECLIAVWYGARKAKTGTKLQSWLYGILFNQCRKYRRSLWRRLRRQEVAGAMLRQNEEDRGSQEQSESLREALGRLDETLRAVIILRFERGMSVLQTADALGVPEGTVKSRTHAAVRQLRKLLGTKP